MNKLSLWYDKIRTFFKEVRIEMKKVSWPNREQLTTYTTVVIIVIIAMSIFVGFVDKIFGKFLEFFLHI